MKLTAALVGISCGSTSPWSVVLVRHTILAVLAGRSVHTKALHCRILISAHVVLLPNRVVRFNAMGCVTITLTPEKTEYIL